MSLDARYRSAALWRLLLAATIGFALLITLVATHTSMNGEPHMLASPAIALQTEQRVDGTASLLMAEVPSAMVEDETRSAPSPANGSWTAKATALISVLMLCILAVAVVLHHRRSATVNGGKPTRTTPPRMALPDSLRIANLTTWRQLGVLRM